MWRYERPQKGRQREFYQFGVEIFGSDKPEADAEMINLAIEALLSFGLTEKDFVIKLNNRKIIEGYFDQLGIKNKEESLTVLDKARKLTEEEFVQELNNIKLSKEQVEKIAILKKPFEVNNLEYSFASKFAFFQNETSKNGLQELEGVFKALDAAGKLKFLQIDFSTVRGLAYYTGTVFECFDLEGKFRAIAGGGRYDNLVSTFGGDATPATGFAMGYSTLSLLLEEKKKIPEVETGTEYFIVAVNDEVRLKVLELANSLRKKHSVEIDLMQRNLSKQMQLASSIDAKKVIVIGPDELKKGEAKIRDMKTGKETAVKLSTL
jgi:histidyl-tRNA synthetase